MAEWERVKLANVTSQVRDAVKPQRGIDYPLLGVRWYAEGPFVRETVNVGTSKAMTLYRVSPGLFIYNRMFAWKGAFALVGSDLAGSFVSNEFPLFECDPRRLLPEFLALHFQQPWVWDQVAVASTGTTASRTRWKEALFADYEVALPSIAEQRRIVDLVAAIDAQIGALEGEVQAASMLAREAAECLLIDAPTRMLGEVLYRVEGGRSPLTTGKPPQESEPGVLKVSAVTAEGFVPEESKALLPGTQLQPSAEVRAGDVLITRANTPGRVGVVCRVPADVRRDLYLCDKTLRLVPREDLIDPDFLVVAMAVRTVRSQLAGAATGTSASMVNISQAKMRSAEIPVPSIAAQQEIAGTLGSMRQVIGALRQERSTLGAFRARLLESLLSQVTQIPESYDWLLLEEASVPRHRLEHVA